MANYDIGWVLGAHVRFGSLDFIIMVGGELVWAHAAIQSLRSSDLDHKRLWCPLGAPLDPRGPGRTSIASPLLATMT